VPPHTHVVAFPTLRRSWATAALCAALLASCSNAEPAPAPTVTVTPPAVTVTPPPVTVTATPPLPATEIINVTALDRQGRVLNDYDLEGKSADPAINARDCGAEPAGSGVTPNTYACGASVFSADACWRVTDGDLACLDLPWDRKLTRRSVDGDLPDTPKAESPEPLGLQLADGSRYRQRNGSGGSQLAPEGYTDSHYCVSGPCADNPDVTLSIVVGVDSESAVNREQDTWWALVGEMSTGEPSGEAPEYQRVVKAWFIATK
jgi:hypothetical protein